MKPKKKSLIKVIPMIVADLIAARSTPTVGPVPRGWCIVVPIDEIDLLPVEKTEAFTLDELIEEEPKPKDTGADYFYDV